MNTESGLISGMDSLEDLLVTRISRPDNCVNQWCGKQISSKRQNEFKGTDICDECAKLDKHEEER